MAQTYAVALTKEEVGRIHTMIWQWPNSLDSINREIEAKLDAAVEVVTAQVLGDPGDEDPDPRMLR